MRQQIKLASGTVSKIPPLSFHRLKPYDCSAGETGQHLYVLIKHQNVLLMWTTSDGILIALKRRAVLGMSFEKLKSFGHVRRLSSAIIQLLGRKRCNKMHIWQETNFIYLPNFNFGTSHFYFSQISLLLCTSKVFSNSSALPSTEKFIS